MATAAPRAKGASEAWRELVDRYRDDPEFWADVDADEPFRSVAESLISLRAELGLSQQALAERAGTTQSVIARLESGRHPAKMDLLNRIATGVGHRWRPVFEVPEPVTTRVVPSANLAVPTFSDFTTTHIFLDETINIGVSLIGINHSRNVVVGRTNYNVASRRVADVHARPARKRDEELPMAS
ncbi:MAG TPA: helix-turn-helix transcriptional regulator [Candidatus Saccharimonadales bacterium]|nr:helix-turn-helix transcriptional regulator [Candidatus Saccharimonadales bacterium]